MNQPSVVIRLRFCFLWVSIQMRRRRVGMIGIMIFIEKTPEKGESWVDFLGL
jgi:hypothetical protein